MVTSPVDDDRENIRVYRKAKSCQTSVLTWYILYLCIFMKTKNDFGLPTYIYKIYQVRKEVWQLFEFRVHLPWKMEWQSFAKWFAGTTCGPAWKGASFLLQCMSSRGRWQNKKISGSPIEMFSGSITEIFSGSPTEIFSGSPTLFTLYLRHLLLRLKKSWHTRLENMILGQLRIGERQMTSAALGTWNIWTLEHWNIEHLSI